MPNITRGTKESTEWCFWCVAFCLFAVSMNESMVARRSRLWLVGGNRCREVEKRDLDLLLHSSQLTTSKGQEVKQAPLRSLTQLRSGKAKASEVPAIHSMPFEAYAHNASTSTKIAVALAIYIVISLFFSSGQSSSSSAGIMASSAGPAFTLLVTLKFKSEKYVDQLLSDIKPLCDYIKANEPTTLAYEVMKSDKDPLMVTLMERYADKDEAYLKIHKSSKPFLEFRPKLKAMQDDGNVEISGESYLDSMVGFGDRVGM